MRKIFLFLIGLLCILPMSGCIMKEYGYEFHFCVEGGNGEIQVDPSFDIPIHLCKEWGCGLNCNEDSHIVSLIGGKKGSRELTFIAVPNDGYKVKEWIFNGKTVEGNDSLYFTAKVTSESGYNGVIVVKFEKIIDNN